MRVDPACQQMTRTGRLADSVVNMIVQDITRDTGKRSVGFEDCWVHAYSTPFSTFQKAMHSVLRAVTVALFHHYCLQVVWGTGELIHIRCTMACNQTMRGKAVFDARSPFVPLH